MSDAADGNEFDRIGRIGELALELLATSSDLLVSKPMPDKTGKDYLVEFPLEPYDAGISYDRRPAPTGCVVQIKTTKATNGKVVCKLTAAERLAHDPRPSAICILRLDENDNVV